MTFVDETPFGAEESPFALARGSRLAEFDVLGLIGEGGFGIVYLAYDTILHRRVAIKEFMPAALAMRTSRTEVALRSPKQREVFAAAKRSFIDEARLLAQFDHASLVKVHRFWEANGTAYMVMPYYEGATLLDALSTSHSRPDEAWLRGILQPLMEALCVLHQSRCYHRDVSPDNILLLKGSERPVLLDFGAARHVINDMTHAPTVFIKSGYAPVEQYGIDRSMAQGPWTDIYALAAVVHFAIVGDTPPPSVARVVQDSYVPLESKAAGRYSPRFLRAIDHALAVQPKDRTQSIGSFASELGICIEPGGARIPASSAGALHASGTARRGRSWSPLVPIVFFVASIVIGVGWRLFGPAATIPEPSAAAKTTRKHEWLASPDTATPASQSRSSLHNSLEPASKVSGVPPVIVTSAPSAALPPYTPYGEMARIVALADPSLRVVAQSPYGSARIGHDRLRFTVTSNRSGFAYVFMADPNGQYMMLFPNRLDRNNSIAAGQALVLPRPSWQMTAGPPPGLNMFLVIVSPVPRDFSDAGLRQQSPFKDIPADAQRESAKRRSVTYSPFAGRPLCAAGADCPVLFGAATFQIEAVSAAY